MADIAITSATVPSEEGGEAGSVRDSTGEQHDDPHGVETPSEGSGAGGAETSPQTPSGAPAGAARGEERDPSRPPAGGISYPEWDDYAGAYKPEAVTVLVAPAAESDDRWALDALEEHAVIVRRTRARFSQLRAHRVRLRAQRAGDELDLDACVTALVDLRMRQVPSDRLYQLTQPARPTLAIAILVDVSGSTREKLPDERTVLDVERMTVLLASEALDALGDAYAVLAFSGCGRHDVQLRTVKRFGTDDVTLVRRRISALTPMDNTRLGAALRHATAVLNAQPAERRLLLLLSDGKPNDVGGYQGVYAVEDSRRALAEARASGVHPFCLTVDREETDYLPHLFGRTGYRLMRTPEQLPETLLRVVQQLIPQ
jgi:nitric oxide reductase NorD protein